MDDLEQIKQKINIIDLIGEYIPLKKTGINYRSNCPFHQEKTPSFMVSPERQIWHCFGCSKGGDIFKFVMEKEGLEFKDALDILAQKAGIVLKRTPDKQKDKKDRLFELNQKALQFYQYLLKEHKVGKPALDYLKNRGLEDKTLDDFQIGYAPQAWETLTNFLKKRGFIQQELIDSGLCVASQRGCYDRFRGRIVFPLYDVRGRILGFSGRILDVGEPKYINSPQTDIFDKSKFLFGISLSKGSLKEKDAAIISEGEMDMIMSYQAGVKNIVASKGTALTEDQIELIGRYTKNILLCFDTDLAGDAAARRGIEMADRAGFNIKVIQFTEGKDPAELVLKDKALWEKAVEEAIPIYDYYLQSVEKRFDIKTAEGKKAIFEEILPIWNKIADPMVKEHYIQKLASFLLMKDDLIRRELQKQQSGANNFKTITQNKAPIPEVKIYNRRQLLEEYLIALLLHIPINITYVPNFPETIFTEDELKQIYVLLVLFMDSISFKARAFKITEFVKNLPEDSIELVDRLYLMEIDEKLEDGKNWHKEVEGVVAELKKMLIKTSLEKLSLQIKNAQEFNKGELLTVLNKRFRDLSVKLKNL